MQRILAVGLAAALAALPAQADEITDTLNSAIEAYNDGDIQYALEEIAYAQQLLSELKADALAQFLPEAPDGWTREDGDGSNIPAFGGGSGASARYSNGKDSFMLTILTDSPMVSAMGNIFSNSVLLASQGKLVRVKREKFLEQGRQLTSVVDGRFLVQAEGAPTDVMVEILELIDYRRLGRFGF